MEFWEIVAAAIESLKKIHPTCENIKDLSYTINEEAINTYKEIMLKEFCSKGDEKSLDTPLKEDSNIHEEEHQ